MKRLIILIIMLLPMMAHAQSDAFKRYLEKHRGQPEFTTIEIPGQMLGTITIMDNKNSSAEMLANTEMLTMIICEECSDAQVKEADEMIKQGDYKLITAISNGSNNVKIFAITGKGKAKNEFLMMINDGKDLVMISITGDLDLKDVSGMSNISIGRR